MVFEPLAANYDQLCTQAYTGQWQREQVWQVLDHHFVTGMQVLELGCGTGIDALHLAGRGVKVCVTDSAPTMVDISLTKAQTQGLIALITGQVLSLEKLDFSQSQHNHFDGGFSNFSAFNCVNNLSDIAQNLAVVLKPNAQLIIVIFGRYCLWEMLGYSLRGQFAKVLRRLPKGATQVFLRDGLTIPTYYHQPQDLITAFSPWFDLTNQVGIGVSVPPTYMEPWVARYAQQFQLSQMLDLRLGATWPYRLFGDHHLLVFRRKV